MTAHVLISRDEALSLGLPSFFTGKPCRKGHVTTRRVKRSWCEECYQLRYKKGRRNLEANRQYYRKWRTENIDHHRAYMRRKRGFPEPTRPCPLTCENCDGPPNGAGSLCLDHCHATGAFRGWLCSRCNVGLGCLGDDLEGLARTQAYLERFHTAHSNPTKDI